MGYSQTEGLFYYADHQRRVKADAARRAARANGAPGRGLDFGSIAVFFFYVALVAVVVAAIRLYSFAMFHIAAFFETVLSYIPFL
ncbi:MULTISPECIES: hypothetical protein [Roseobacteraceae]|uniref:hypothetical protein n=1 Tax=Roseobacteraceae TaxID=2854170 RepID=UPI00260CDFAE|nr:MULTISPECIES: hypothetical protein [Roseobacteraceae]